MTHDEFEGLPVFSIAGETRVVTDALTGEARLERERPRFLLQHDPWIVRDHVGDLWLVFTDQGGTTWRQRLWL